MLLSNSSNPALRLEATIEVLLRRILTITGV